VVVCHIKTSDKIDVIAVSVMLAASQALAEEGPHGLSPE